MKLEHLIQAYKINGIEAKLKEENEATGLNNKERAGVISFGNGISASYLLDNEEIVVAMKMFFNCLASSFKVDEQISHAAKVIRVMQKTIMLLSNISQKECNMILQSLGLFDNTFTQGKQIQHLDHTYKIEIIDGLLCLSINEKEEER